MRRLPADDSSAFGVLRPFPLLIARHPIPASPPCLAGKPSGLLSALEDKMKIGKTPIGVWFFARAERIGELSPPLVFRGRVRVGGFIAFCEDAPTPALPRSTRGGRKIPNAFALVFATQP